MLTRRTVELRKDSISLLRAHRAFTRPLSLRSPLLSASKGELTLEYKFESSLTNKSSETNQESPDGTLKNNHESSESHPTKQSNPNKAKTVSQSDAELRERLEQMSGDGGAAGIEYEDGKPVAMKRSVRNNMFRLI